MNLKMKRGKLILSLCLVVALFLTGCSGDGQSDGESTVPQEKYELLVLNQNGEVVSGAEVNLGGSSGTTSDYGMVTFDKPNQGSVPLTVSCTDYYSYSATNFSISGHSGKVTIKSRNLKSHVLKSAIYKKLESVDLVDTYKKLNKGNDTLDFSITASVSGDEDSVSKYELRQKNENGNRLISESADGFFGQLNVEKFLEGTGVFVTVYDGRGHQTSTSLKFEIAKDPDYSKYSEMSIGDGLEFSVGDDIPVFGGSKFKLDFPSIPLEYKVSEEQIHIGFNVDEDTFSDEAKINEYKKLLNEINRAKYAKNNYKKLVQQLKKRQKKKGLMNMSGFDKGIDISVGGYAEAGFNSDGTLSSGTGQLCITLSASASFDWQLVVYFVPVTIGIDGEIEADLSSTVGYSFEDNKFSGDTALTIKPSLKAKAGAGFKYLSAGVYGGAGLETKLVIASLTEKPGFDYVDLESSIGIYAKVAFFEPEKELAKGTFHLWARSEEDKRLYAANRKNQSKKYLSDYSDLYDLTNYRPIRKKDNIKLRAANGEEKTTISSGINPGAMPVSASDGKNAVSIYSAQEAFSDSEYTYSKLYYSTYSDGTWSNGNMICDDVCNEMNPELYSDGKDYYLAYQGTPVDISLLDGFETKSDSEKKEIMRKIWKSIDIHVKKYSFDDGTWQDLGCIETDGVYDYQPSITVKDGILYVMNASNLGGDYFGTEQEHENEIHCSSYQSGTWNTVVLQKELNSVTDLAAGVQNGTAVCLYSVDRDNDLTTTSDGVLYLNDGNNSNEIFQGDISQIGRCGQGISGGKLYFASLSSVYLLGDDGKAKEVASEMDSYDGYYSISDQAIYFVGSVENGTEIFARYALEDGSYSEPVKVTDLGRWQRDICVFSVGGEDIVTALSSEYDAESDSGIVSSEVNAYDVQAKYDIGVEDVDFDYGSLQGGDALPISATVLNQGNQTVDAIDISLRDSDGREIDLDKKSLQVKLLPGEKKEISLNAALAGDLAYGKWKLSVNAAVPKTDEQDGDGAAEEIIDANEENNSVEFLTSYSDFVIKTQVNDTGAYPFLTVEITNEGNMADSTRLLIHDANDPTQEYASRDISSLETGSTKLFKINLKEDWADANGKIAVRAMVEESKDELYAFNNFSYEYATVNYGTFAINYVLNGGVNAEKNPSSYTTMDSVDFAEPEREGYDFVGWFTNENFDTITQISNIPVGSAQDITLYAKWKKREQVKNEPTQAPVATKKPAASPTKKPSSSSSGSSSGSSSTSTKTKKHKLIKKPSKVKIKKLKKSGKRRAKVTWGKVKCTNGYQIQYSRKKNFSGKKKITASGKSAYIYGKSKKTYYVRVRAVNWGYTSQTKLGYKYGKWSKVKKIKLK